MVDGNPYEGADFERVINTLKDANKRYQSVSHHLPLAILITSLKGNIIEFNESLLRILTLNPEDLRSKSIRDIIFSEDVSEILSLIQKIETGKITGFECEINVKSSNGNHQKFFCAVSTGKDSKGLPLFISFTFQNIDQKKSSLELLRENDTHITALIYDAPVAIGILQKENLIIEFANVSMLELWGKTAAIIGKPLLQALPEITRQPFPDLLKEVFESGKPHYGNETKALLNRKSGLEEVYFNFVYSPVKSSNGTVTGIMIIASEVTGQVKAKKELEASERRFRELIETADVATALYMGENFVIQFANEAMLNLWAKDSSVIGRKLEEAIPELEGQPFIKLLQEVYSTGKTYKATEDRADFLINGRLESFFFSFSYKALKNADGKVYAILNMAVDVTELVRAKENFIEAEQRSRMVIEASEQGTYEIDLLTGEMNYSVRLLEIFGIPASQKITHEDLIARIYPEDRIIREQAHNRSFETGVLNYEARILWDNQTIRWAKFTGRITFDVYKTPVSIYGIVMDITIQKQEEIRKNDFIAMASHELKTPLTSVKGYLQVLAIESEKHANEFLQNVVARAKNQADKMAKLVNDFLDLSRIETGRLTLNTHNFPINKLVEETISDTRLINRNNFIRFIKDKDVIINADREKIGQVLSNFLSNAIKYSPGESEIIVRSEVDEGLVTISVSDKGPGITSQEQLRIFERYYRIESEKNKLINGFGIGLYISAEIIQRHNGEIGVESEEGKGSTFYFRLNIK